MIEEDEKESLVFSFLTSMRSIILPLPVSPSPLLPFPFLSILSFLSSLFCFSQYTALILLSCSFFFRCYCHFFRRLFYVIYTPFICSCPYPYFSCHYANISLFSVCEHISLIRVRTYLSYQCTNTSLLSVYEHISLLSVYEHISLISV